MSRARLEIRCWCERRPLLAVCGRTSRGEGFVHIKAWKGSRLLTEVVVTSGVAKIKCREIGCGRWHTVRIVYGAMPESDGSEGPPSREILSVLEARAKSR